MAHSDIVLSLAEGFWITLKIFFITLILSIPLGLLVSLGRISKNRILSGAINIYISIMRGTPLMLQLICVYFCPYYVFGVSFGTGYRMTAIYIAFAINYAAYFGEIFRSGIQSTPVGQYEAAKILGYSRSQTFLNIVLPQVVKRVLPAVCNEVITLVKDTSFAFTLSVMEMFTTAKALAAGQTSMMPLFVAGVFYYIFNFVVAKTFDSLEKGMGYYHF